MIDSNWTSGASIMGRDSNGSTKVKDITATGVFQGGAGAFPDGITGNNATIGGNNEISNLTVTGTFVADAGTQFNGNSLTATTATNVVGGANRIPYNSASNSTTTSSNLQFNGTKLTVQALKSNTTIEGSINGNSASSSTVAVANADGPGGNFNLLMTNDNVSSSASVYRDTGIYYNAGNNALTVNGDITALASDIRLKENIEQIEGAVAKVCQLRGFTYEFNQEARHSLRLPKGRHAGVSAQEVEKVLPEAVAERANDRFLTVKYEKLVPLLIEAIKELKDEIEELKNGG
jgi:hypothetical protein